MSGGNKFGAALVSGMMSQIGQALIGSKSIYMQRGSQALTPAIRDDTLTLPPLDNLTAPAWASGQKVRFSLPKTSTLVGCIWVEATISDGQTIPPYTPAIQPIYDANTQVAFVPAVGTPQAAYCKNFGDLIWQDYTLRYGSNMIQYVETEYQVINRRLFKNDVNIEAINADVLGGLPPGGAGEQVLIDAFYNGVTIYTPLEELFFTHSQDEYWMPESLALEGEIILSLRGPGEVIYTATGAAPNQLPLISGVQLRYQEITLSAAEKENRLKLYKSPEGHVVHFLDNEFQPRFVVAGSGTGPTILVPNPTLPINVPLSNFRMDMAEIVFVCRVINTAAVAAPISALVSTVTGFPLTGSLGLYGGSRLESNQAASLVTGASIATVAEVQRFRLTAGGKAIFDWQPGLWNRTTVRKFYHPDSQIADGYYCIPLARYPEDFKNATGHLSASVLGSLILQIEVLNPGSAFSVQTDVWSHSHNLVQIRAGGMAKALN